MRPPCRRPAAVLSSVAAIGLAAAVLSTSPTATGSVERSGPAPAAAGMARGAVPVPRTAIPQFDHVLTVVFENKKQGSIIGNPDAPYFNTLAAGGANFTQSYGVTHPSQPNYVALFSGSTHGLTDDTCPHTFKADNEAHQLIKAGYSFRAFSEQLPHAGSKVCTSGTYARKHAPWANFPNVPKASQQPYRAFPTDYTQLPDVSWVIPDLCDDMHDCSIAHGDAWLESELGAYAEWATDNNSLLVVTFDEDDRTSGNQIATIFYGAHVVPGDYDEHITHYSVLRTIEDMYGVKRLGQARKATTIRDIWN